MGEVDKTRPKHLMTFLEPAISGISVPDAVAAWKKYIIPIRQKYPKMTVGSPSVMYAAQPLYLIRTIADTV